MIINNFFVTAVSTLELKNNGALLNDANHLLDPVEKALHKFKDHPSILEIKKNVNTEVKFSFSSVTDTDMKEEISVLDIKKIRYFLEHTNK